MNEYKVWLTVVLEKSYKGCVAMVSDKEVDTLRVELQTNAELREQLIQKLISNAHTKLTNEQVKIDLIYPSSPVSIEPCHSSSSPILQSP